MEITPIIDHLRAFLPSHAIKESALLKDMTTFCIGGPCDLLVSPEDEEQGVRCINALREAGIPFVVLGNGSNVLVHDEGIRGCVVRFRHRGDEVVVNGDGHTLYVGAGEGMMRVAHFAIKHGLSGVEFASGIPGTLGGTVFMNAGAYECEMKDVVQSVRVLTRGGEVMEIDNPGMRFAYRSSAAQENDWLILGATLRLTPDAPENIRARVEDFSRRRREKQPIDVPSAGSTFKRPQGHFAAKLIDDAGLKGARVGGAEVSTLHAGFIVNRGGATYADVVALMTHIKRVVADRFGVALKPEVRLLGPML
jgi:UDP-N-acetylmuramate dehydrogenase